MRHRASTRFWQLYGALPSDIKALADSTYARLRQDPSHRSLHFKKVGRFWSVRVGLRYRAVAIEEGAELVWFWIGRHDEYERIIGVRH